jgi:hypothetical protein
MYVERIAINDAVYDIDQSRPKHGGRRVGLGRKGSQSTNKAPSDLSVVSEPTKTLRGALAIVNAAQAAPSNPAASTLMRPASKISLTLSFLSTIMVRLRRWENVVGPTAAE